MAEKKEILNSRSSTIRLANRLQNLRNKFLVTVQSLLFDKTKFNEKQAKAWAKLHGFKFSKTDITEKKIRIRQKTPSKFNFFRTVTLVAGVKAVVARKNKANMKGKILMKGFSKFGKKVLSDMQIPIPMSVEMRFLCEGSNRDGIIEKERLETCICDWDDIAIIDWHDKSDKPTEHKLSDRAGYLTNPRVKFEDGRFWIYADAQIIKRDLAYQIYLRQKQNKPLEVSAEYGWIPEYKDGLTYQTMIRPHLMTITDNGHIEGNKLMIKNMKEVNV